MKEGREEGKGGRKRRGEEIYNLKKVKICKFCVFYQIRHDLQNAQDFWVTQLIVGKIEDAKFHTLL